MQKTTDNRGRKKIAPSVVTVLILLYIVPVLIGIIRAFGFWGQQGETGLLVFLLLYLFFGGAVVGGVLKALAERLREIDGGEEEDASQY